MTVETAYKMITELILSDKMSPHQWEFVLLDWFSQTVCHLIVGSLFLLTAFITQSVSLSTFDLNDFLRQRTDKKDSIYELGIGREQLHVVCVNVSYVCHCSCTNETFSKTEFQLWLTASSMVGLLVFSFKIPP